MGSGSARGAAAALTCAALLVGGTAAGASAQSRTLNAPGFHDSVGISTHASYFDTPYGRWGDVIARFRELGVRHMRTGIYASDNAGWNGELYGRLGALAAAGVRLQLIVQDTCSPDRSVDRCLDAVRRRLPPSSVAAIEWPDESDRAGREGWAPTLAAWGRLLYAKVKADPSLRHLPVVGPALVRYASPAVLGDQSRFLDLGNVQPYTGALSPNPAYVLDAIARHGAVFSTKPVVATEAGFHTALQDPRPDQPAADEPTAAVYTLRTLLEHYADGIRRTFLYELVDEGADVTRADLSYGLLRSDFSPKPAFTAVSNLLRMVGTTGPPAVTPLRYRVTGDTAGLRELVLQQDARTYLLILWRTASVWNRNAKRPVAVVPRSYGVEVPGLAAFARGSPLAGPGLEPGTFFDGRIIQPVGAAPRVLRLTIQPGGQGAGTAPGTGTGTAGGEVSGRPGAADRTRPRISKIRAKRITRRRYAVYFRLSEAATVGARLDRARPRSRKRYRLLRRVAARRLRGGMRRRITVGTFRVGRHRVLLAARDAAGNRTYVLSAFKIRQRKRR